MKALVLACALVAGVSQAAILKGNSEHCSLFAHNMLQMAVYRDAGASWAELEPVLDGMLEEAIGHPASIVDKEDAVYVKATAKSLWGELAKVPPQEVVARVATDCMKANQKRKAI